MSQKIVLNIDGMTCQACASRIEKVLNKKPFVQNAAVNFASEKLLVEFDERQASLAQIVEIVAKTGFRATLDRPESAPQAGKFFADFPHWQRLLLWLIALPFGVAMVGMFTGNHALMLPPIVQFALASFAQLGLAQPFYRSAIASLKGRLANMDVLVSCGTLIIYLYSTGVMWHENAFWSHSAPVYFEAGVMVLAFVSLGKFLEERTKKQSLNSLSELISLTPKDVRIQRENSWENVPISAVKQGDLVQAVAGERICADGVVESGLGWADESPLTGEPLPELKQPASRVLAGALLTQGSVVYRAEQLGSQTLLGDMFKALEQAQGSKAPIARFADKVAGVFVPAVMAFALLAFLLNGVFTGDWAQALVRGVAVLVIACPCALGLATPAAIMVGMGKAARAGIWFKDAAALEHSAQVDTVVLDKTGTLTTGKPQIAAVQCWAAESEDALLQLAASVAQHSAHPLAAAMVVAGRGKFSAFFPAHHVQTVAGAGTQAEVAGVGVVKVGSPRYCEVALPADLDAVWQVASVVAVSVNGVPFGAFALTDSLKADSLEAVERLQKSGVDVRIFSGDQPQAVAYWAQKLGISAAFGNLSPREKAEKIQTLQQFGKTVAMVGDGVNDAPALAAAAVSFAMQNGTDVAQQTASATLMRHSVVQVAEALAISQATLTNIKQNLFFAMIYNALGIPLAAAGYLSPVLAGAAMALSSLSVLANALRLKRQKVG